MRTLLPESYARSFDPLWFDMQFPMVYQDFYRTIFFHLLLILDWLHFFPRSYSWIRSTYSLRSYLVRLLETTSQITRAAITMTLLATTYCIDLSVLTRARRRNKYTHIIPVLRIHSKSNVMMSFSTLWKLSLNFFFLFQSSWAPSKTSFYNYIYESAGFCRLLRYFFSWMPMAEIQWLETSRIVRNAYHKKLPFYWFRIVYQACGEILILFGYRWSF